MMLFIILCASFYAAFGHPTMLKETRNIAYSFPYMSRSQWGARPPIETTSLSLPAPYAVIHHSYIPAACFEEEACKRAMRSMQNSHMDTNNWWDIGYNFGIGSDGTVYEGRGWNVTGAHALNFNSISIGICLIGDWRYELPPAEQLKSAKALIAAGVELGYLCPDYKLTGHRQVRATECPGDALYKDIQSWPHYSSFPSSVSDLVNVPELPEKVKQMLRNNTSQKH